MKTFTRFSVVILTFVALTSFQAEKTMRAANETWWTTVDLNYKRTACSILIDEFVSLIQSIDHAEEYFLFGTELSKPRMWWGASLGLNESLDEPYEREVLENTILRLREERRTVPELAVFLRTPSVRNEQNAQDFFFLASYFCERGLITKAEIHTDSAIMRAHTSLGDTYSMYLTPVEAENFWHEVVSDIGEVPSGTNGLTHAYRLGENTYLLKITSFLSTHVASDVRNTLKLIVLECTFPHIILDLRDNPGGFIEASIEVSKNFLRNQIIVQLEDRSGLRQRLVAGVNDNNFHFMSTTVLVNQWTASGAEIVAAALDENGAVTVGRRTYGKAVGQHSVKLSNGGTSRITSLRLFSPLGNSWQGSGITPEIDLTASSLPHAGEEERVELRNSLGDFYLDGEIVASYRLIRERESWDPRCRP